MIKLNLIIIKKCKISNSPLKKFNHAQLLKLLITVLQIIKNYSFNKIKMKKTIEKESFKHQ